MKEYELFPYATNKDGTKIFCRLAYKKKSILKGFYDYNIEKFIITKYVKQNIPINLSKNKIKTILKQILLITYDWNI